MAADGSVIINTMINTAGITRGLGKVTGSMKKAGGTVGKQIVHMQDQFDGLGQKISGVGKMILAAFSVSALIDFGKEAIELGSDLEEVQNVVDSVFTSMSKQVDEFAQGAAKAYGLSETMAKRYTGTLGSMAKAFHFNEQEAFEMATTLTGLVGDVASFYNLDQDVAFSKMKSVFTGETESLKELGIVMTQTALDEYALANGFGKTTSAMTEQEKVALRYHFVLDQLSTASGDFAKTSDGWANQVRILKLQVDSLKASIGQGLINLFTPVLKVINTIIGKLATLANAFKAFTELITGKKSTGSTDATSAGLGDIATAADGAADSTSNLADATNDAAEATQKARKEQDKYLTGLDEINRYRVAASADTGGSSPGGSSGGSGGGGGAGGLVSGVDYGKLAEGESVVDKLEQKFSKLADLLQKKDWKGLGEYMANGLNAGLKKVYDMISWKNVDPKITEFTNALTTVFNSLVKNFDWDLLGRTIGAGITTVTTTLWQLVDGVDWIGLGSGFAAEVNGLVDEVDWNNVGNLLGGKIQSAWDIFYGFVIDLDYKKIGLKLADMLNSATKQISPLRIAVGLTSAINGAFEALGEFVKKYDWGILRAKIRAGLNYMIHGIKWRKAGKAVNDLLNELIGILTDVANGVDWESFGEGIGDFLSEIDWGKHLANLFTALYKILSGIWKGLGKTTAGKFVQGFIIFKITLTMILPFVNALCALFTGSTVTGMLSAKFAALFGAAATAGAEGAASGGALAAAGAKVVAGLKIAGGAVASAAPAAGVAGAAVGAGYIGLKGVKAVQDELEKARGGNGLSETYSPVFDVLIGKLKKIGVLTNEQYENIWLNKEAYESVGKTGTEAYLMLIGKLNECGISQEEVNKCLQIMRQEGGLDVDMIELLGEHVGGLNIETEEAAQAFRKMNSSIDLSTYGYADETFDDLDESLRRLYGVGVIKSVDQLTYLQTVLQRCAEEGMTTQETYETLTTEMEKNGISTERYAEIIGVLFPDAVVAGANTISGEAMTLEELIDMLLADTTEDLEGTVGTVEEAADAVTTATEDVGTQAEETAATVDGANDKMSQSASDAKDSITESNTQTSESYEQTTDEIIAASEKEQQAYNNSAEAKGAAAEAMAAIDAESSLSYSDYTDDVEAESSEMYSKLTGDLDDYAETSGETWGGVRAKAEYETGQMTDTVSTNLDAQADKVEGANSDISDSTTQGWEESEKSVDVNLAKMWLTVQGKMGEIFGMIRDRMQDSVKIYGDKFKSMANLSSTYMRNIKSKISTGFTDIGTTVSKGMSGMSSNVSGTLNSLTDQVSTAMSTIATSISGAFGSMSSGIIGPINDFVAKLNYLIGAAQAAQNTIAGLLSFDITLPDVVAQHVGWSHAWLDIPKKNADYRVPYLATGAVIPPNAPFMAMLGDQKRGNNIEAPEDLIRKIVREEAGGSRDNITYHFSGRINGRILFEEVLSEARIRRDQSGRNPFELT